jgi:hypothetical protein
VLRVFGFVVRGVTCRPKEVHRCRAAFKSPSVLEEGKTTLRGGEPKKKKALCHSPISFDVPPPRSKFIRAQQVLARIFADARMLTVRAIPILEMVTKDL